MGKFLSVFLACSIIFNFFSFQVKTNNIRAGRYPGGSVAAYWDWENPCGTMGCSTLDPSFEESQRAPENEWMSIEEYFDFVDETGHGILMHRN